MNKLTALGALSFIFGITLIVFKAIANVTGKTISLPDLTIEQTLAPARLKWIEDLPEGFLLSCSEQIVTTPLYIYCLIIGFLFFVLGGVMGSK